ncbi:MAG: DedA family protein [Gammaproteobacteria bacterium]|nr:DedA family protein [Gammaproteobacteria bacterium]
MLTAFITDHAVRLLESTGYAGAGFLMALESMIFPIPSEAVMPFVGFLVADGRWNLWLALVVTSAGSLVGSLLSYALGFYAGKPAVLKVGRYLLLNAHDLAWTERFFQRRAGATTVFIARFIPVVRHLISIPAGIGRMPLLPFMAVTLLGATAWNGFLLYCGMRLREHWPMVQSYSHEIDLAVAAILLVMAGGYVVRRLKRTQ